MKISAPPSALEPVAAPVRFDPVTEPPGPTDANPDVGEAIRVQDLPLPASIQALRAGARNGSRSRSQLDDPASDTEAAPGAGRSGRDTTRAGAPPSDPPQATAVAPPPPPPSRPSEYTGEAPVSQQWLSQRHRYLQALRSDIDAQRAAAMSSPGGPGWIDAPMSTDESGGQQYAGAADTPMATTPDGRAVVFDEAAWRAHYAATLDARGVLVATALANLYGAAAMNDLDAVVRAQLIELAAVAGSQPSNAGPAPAGMAMGDAAQLAQLDQYLAQPQIRELIDLYGGAPPAATSDLAREQVRLYGQERFEQMGRLANAMAHVREDYRRAFEQAQAAGQGPGWIERTTTVATTDEYGAASEVAVTQRVFDADAFTAAYGAQSDAANRAFRDLYGASHSTTSTSEAGGESTSYTVTHTSTTFADSGWVAEDGVMTHRDLLGLDLNTARLRDNRAVGFDARAGWVTSQANVDRGRSFFDRIGDALDPSSLFNGPTSLMQMPLQLTQPLTDALPGPASSLLRNESDFLSGLIAAPEHMVGRLGDAASHGWPGMRDLLENPVIAPMPGLEFGAHGLVQAITTFDMLRGELHERRLSADEINQLRAVYGDSIDYDAVRVRWGGSRRTGIDAIDRFTADNHVEDNAIWFNRDTIDAQGNVKDYLIFVHEMAHVWQFQHRGTGTGTGSFVGQITDPGGAGRGDGANPATGDGGATGAAGFGTAYDWYQAMLDGKTFEQMNPESQAEMALYIAATLQAGGGQFTEDAFRTVLEADLIAHEAVRLNTPENRHRAFLLLSHVRRIYLNGG